MKALLYLVRLLILAAVVGACSLAWFFKEVSRPANPAGEAAVFQVAEGATGRWVADDLERKGLIANSMAFRLLLMLKEKREKATLRAGYFEVDPKNDTKAVLDELLYGEPLTRRATIPEGYTLEQTVLSLEKQNVCSAEKVWLALGSDKLLLDWKFPKELEGYLFPSTYDFPYECSGEDVVRQMTTQFRTSVEPIWEKYKDSSPLGFKEAIILASMIEREAQVASERALIAGVYVNRLRKGMKLQCDATVQYALGKPKAVLLYSDLEVASPYNTYRYAGLPPGPICSAGLASIEAAMHPKPSNYLFYVRNDVKNDGSHVFASDEWGHQDNIARYQR